MGVSWTKTRALPIVVLDIGVKPLERMDFVVFHFARERVGNSTKPLLSDVFLFNRFELAHQLEYSIFREVDESFLMKVFFFGLRFHLRDFLIQQ